MKTDDFIALGYSPQQSILLEDAHRAITRAKLWQYFANPSTPGKDGFIFCKDQELFYLQKYLRYDGYTAESYAWTMNEMKRFIPKPKTHFTSLWKEFLSELDVSGNPMLQEFAQQIKR
jgi:hypothetical protein